MLSITLTNIPQFVEQPGRTITKAQGELDKMTVPYLGPWNQQVPFQVGTPDTTYPLMFCTGYNENDNGGLHELKVNYAGVAVTNGTMPYLTEPLLSITPVQGSRDFQQIWSAMTSTVTISETTTSFGQSNTQSVTTYFYSVGTQRVNIRYIGTSVVLRYYTIPEPSFNAPQLGRMGLERVGFSVLSSYLGEVSVAATNVTGGTIGAVIESLNIPSVPGLYAAYMGMRISQIGEWYQVEETYAPTF